MLSLRRTITETFFSKSGLLITVKNPEQTQKPDWKNYFSSTGLWGLMPSSLKGEVGEHHWLLFVFALRLQKDSFFCRSWAQKNKNIKNCPEREVEKTRCELPAVHLIQYAYGAAGRPQTCYMTDAYLI